MTTETTDAPAAPFTLPDAKPSQLVRSLAMEHWCRGASKAIWPDGVTAWCARGILAEHFGLKFRSEETTSDGIRCYTTRIADLVAALGLDWDEVVALSWANDMNGKDAAADLLEAWGM